MSFNPLNMFDWDDQELANIIWGEGREAEDHIVPYPEDIEKKVLSDYGDNEQKRLIREVSKSEIAGKNTSTSKVLDGGKRDKSDDISVSGAVIGSQLEIPSFSASKSDQDRLAKKSQLDIGLEICRNHDEDKELGDLVGNSWVSIGSFDDLDQIFSNDDLDGNTSLGSTDELWSSPKDLLSGPAKSSAALGSTSWEFGALGNTSAEINSEFLQNENPSVAAGHQKANNLSPYSRQKFRRNVEQEYPVGTAGLVEDKIGLGITVKTANDSHIVAETIASPRKSINKEQWSKHKSKQEQENDGRTASRLLRGVYDSWPSSSANVPQFGRQCAPATVQNYSASLPGQQTFSQDFSPMPYHNFSTPYGASYAYGNFSNQHPVVGILKPTENEHQSILSTSEVSPGDVIYLNKPPETTTKPAKMTPEEKIEKLRRRQQMRAMLAIQKQQQQLGRQASSGEYPLSHKSCPEDQVHHIEKSDLGADEVLRLPCYDPGSSNKGDDSSRISNIDDYSVEDTVLYQLQDIISRLDMKIRLCIRDSLYRLAHSASQRHCASDTSGTKRSGTYEHDVAKEETNNDDRIGSLNVETETNHIDRAVAHLLFHRPLKLPPRHVETPESSTSTKVSTDLEAAAPRNLQVGSLTKSSENEFNLSPHGSKSPREFMNSQEEDVSHKEMRINPQMKEMKAEHAE